MLLRDVGKAFLASRVYSLRTADAEANASS